MVTQLNEQNHRSIAPFLLAWTFVTALAALCFIACAPSAFAQTDATEPVSRADLPADLTPWVMFLNAGKIVEAVIVGLAFASLVTWTVFVAKTLELRNARSEVRRGLRILNNSATLAQAHEQLRNGTSPVAPVSYTHLDVYKRQSRGSTKYACRRICRGIRPIFPLRCRAPNGRAME